MVLNGASTAVPSTPFFRYPGFPMFGADVIADDWIPMTEQAQLKLLADRLQAAGKGIVLLHDPEARTAAVLPALPRYLRDNGYSIVHVVPGTSVTPAAGVPQSGKRE